MFYIEKIIIRSGDDVFSQVELTPGLNIVHGESNTGKSLILDCIDYLFGAEVHRFDQKLKIKQVTLIINNNGDSITLSREIDSNDIKISTTADYIENGTYKIGHNAKRNINRFWLQLMGIEEPVKILMTLGGKPQSLTLRTFYHLILIDEDRIYGKQSLLSQGKGVNPKVATSVLSSLLFLATGKTYLPDSVSRDPAILKAKREAVKAFVDRSMSILETRKVQELSNLIPQSPDEIQRKIDRTLNELGSAEGALSDAINKSNAYADELYKIDAQITESRVLQNRNASLLTQYQSDIRRMTFVVEGELNHESVPKLETCPFCNGTLSKKQEESCVSAAIAEVNKIEAQIKDLRSVQTSITEELEELKRKRQVVYEERLQIDSVIRAELQPQIDKLKKQLGDYKLSLNQYKANEMLDEFSDVLINELEELQKEEDSEIKVDLTSEFREVFMKKLDEELKHILKNANYNNLVSAYFDFDEKDIVVNGHKKRTQGQGYRAYFNTILGISIHNCLLEFAKYRFDFLVFDSPLQSLMERKDTKSEQISETMKAGLMQYLMKSAGQRQTIIIENKIPNIDYSGANQIIFTHDTETGRYGLIEGYTED